MKKLKYLLFILPFLFVPNVFADTTYDMTNRITSPVEFSECGVGSYTGVELNGATHCWNTNTRNYGTLSRIYFNLPAPVGNAFEDDTVYRLSLYMATNDWRNRFGTVKVSPGSSYTNNYVDSFSFVSMKQVNITFTVPYSGSTTFQTLWVDLPATNTSTLITGETNWNLSRVTLTKVTSGSSGGSTTPSGPSTSFDDTAIINNQNENTQDIINNNNSNTQDIINNNNNNSQEIINNQNENTNKVVNELANVCPNLIDLNKITNCRFYNNSPDSSCDSTILNKNNSTGTVTFSTTADWQGFTTDFIPVSNSTLYYLKFNRGSVFDGIVKVNFYTSNQQFISQTLGWNNNVSSFTTPNNSSYIKISFENSSSNNSITLSSISLTQQNISFCAFGSTTSKLDSTNNAINDVNDSINNSNIDNGVGEGFFDNFTSQDFGLSQIITIPLNTIQGLTSKSCVPLQVPIPFTNSNINLPCMTEIYETKFPTIYNLWKIVSFGIVAYLIAIDIFHIVKGFKDPESDKVEVLDL